MKKKRNLSIENKELKARLVEAEELLAAIKRGEVDAFITDDQQVFTLKSADHVYKAFVETINEGALTLAHDGTIMYCNKRLAEVFGLPIEKIIGASIFDFVVPDEIKKLKSVLTQSKNKTTRAEFQFKRNGNSATPTLVSCNPLEMENKGLCMVITDLTQQKNVEAELKKHRDHLEEMVRERTAALTESEKRFRALTETSSLAVGVSSCDGKFLYINKAYERMFGYTIDELSEVNATELWLDLKDRQNMVKAIKEKSVILDYEAQLKRKNGTPIWASITINLISFTGVEAIMATVYDITERKAAEKALRENEENLKRAQAVGNIGSWRLDVRKNELLWSDESYCIFGVRKGTPQTYESFLSICHPDDREYVDKKWKASMTGEDYDIEHRIVADGKVKWVREKAYLEFDEKGSLLASFGITQDITVKKESEEVLKRDKEIFEKLVKEKTDELIEAHIELDRAKRLSDIGVLAATVAHELRNPLAAIGMAAHNIKRKAKNPNFDKHLSTIDKKVAESDRIINNLLFYSRLKSPHFEKINIFDIIEESIESANDKSRKEISTIRNLDSLKDISIEADAFQIKEVFLNILNNAHDAVSAGTGEIKIASEADEEYITISIEDNGPGIGQDIIDKIFDPFFTTKAKGTGLGLSVCKQIISMHDGEIGVKKGFTKGTCVFVQLPKERKKERKNKWPLNEF